MASALDRRTFLGALVAAGGVLAGCGAQGADAAGRDPLDAWGVQLYTLRDRLAEDLDGTLAAVAAVGYREVELFQLHGLTPRAMRQKLDGVGLRATSSHYPIQALREGLDEAVEGAVTLGQRFMVLPSIPGEERTPDGLARVADDLSRAGERARQAGLRVGYHNHDWELRRRADGSLPIDVLLDRADPDLVDWQMDIFWTVHGGGDP
ncbi:MAG: TIM barrel protein, partial [Longimicrobiales bacterium]|nr:TIM barrel protein [Longimicrobiales bacterium]